jgi:hypothetical protein
MRARAHVRSQDYWRALWSLQKDVKLALDKAKILPAVPRQAAITRVEPPGEGNSPPGQSNAQQSAADGRPVSGHESAAL